VTKADKEEPPTTFTFLAIYSEDNILHKTFESLEDLNAFIKTDIIEGENSALIFVAQGVLLSESQWRLPEDQTDKYWTII
jgi:hypothetical protein